MDLDAKRKGAGPIAWALRLLTVGMALAAIFVAARKFRTTPEQEELTRYAELMVPSYLEDVARVEELLDRLFASPTTTREQARAMLVDEVMPATIKARNHAQAVVAQAESVKTSNAEYLAALEKLMEVGRTGVRVLDDPAVSGADGFRAVREARRKADDGIREFMAHLRERCERAGFTMTAEAKQAKARK